MNDDKRVLCCCGLVFFFICTVLFICMLPTILHNTHNSKNLKAMCNKTKIYLPLNKENVSVELLYPDKSNTDVNTSNILLVINKYQILT